MAHKVHRIYEQICTPEAVCMAGYNTICGKRKRHDVQRLFRSGYIKALDNVWRLLNTETFEPQPCRHKRIYDSGKWRTLTIPMLYPDRIIDHCIVDNT